MSRDDLRDLVFLDMAEAVSRLATCNRLHVGAVIVNARRKIVSTGYNGAPGGHPHCDDVGHRLIDNSCLRTIHAESNAVSQAHEDRRDTQGSTLYCTHMPCSDCARDIIRASIVRVVYSYKFLGAEPKETMDLFEAAGIELVQLEREWTSHG